MLTNHHATCLLAEIGPVSVNERLLQFLCSDRSGPVRVNRIEPLRHLRIHLGSSISTLVISRRGKLSTSIMLLNFKRDECKKKERNIKKCQAYLLRRSSRVATRSRTRISPLALLRNGAKKINETEEHAEKTSKGARDLTCWYPLDGGPGYPLDGGALGCPPDGGALGYPPRNESHFIVLNMRRQQKPKALWNIDTHLLEADLRDNHHQGSLLPAGNRFQDSQTCCQLN